MSTCPVLFCVLVIYLLSWCTLHIFPSACLLDVFPHLLQFLGLTAAAASAQAQDLALLGLASSILIDLHISSSRPRREPPASANPSILAKCKLFLICGSSETEETKTILVWGCFFRDIHRNGFSCSVSQLEKKRGAPSPGSSTLGGNRRSSSPSPLPCAVGRVLSCAGSYPGGTSRDRARRKKTEKRIPCISLACSSRSSPLSSFILR